VTDRPIYMTSWGHSSVISLLISSLDWKLSLNCDALHGLKRSAGVKGPLDPRETKDREFASRLRKRRKDNGLSKRFDEAPLMCMVNATRVQNGECQVSCENVSTLALDSYNSMLVTSGSGYIENFHCKDFSRSL